MNASTSEPPSILLVDDEPEILHSLKGLLRREFTLHTAETGQQALQILRQVSIQVIMTDQRMPQMTGAQLLGQARAISPDTIRPRYIAYQSNAPNHFQRVNLSKTKSLPRRYLYRPNRQF